MICFINRRFILIAALGLCGLSACGLSSSVKPTSSVGACPSGSIESGCAAESSKFLTLTSRRPLVIKSGDTVALIGTGFNKAMSATVGGIPVTSLEVTSATSASLVVPAGLATGMSELNLTLNTAEATASMAYMPSSERQLFTGSVSEICAGVAFYNINGDLKTGTKSCSAAITPECTANAATGCVTTTSYKSADFTNLLSSNIKSGVTIAGVSGSVTGTAADCATNGAQSCYATGLFKAATTCSATESDCYLPPASDTRAPTAPRYLIAMTAENGQVSLAWSAPAGGPTISSYKIYRGLTTDVWTTGTPLATVAGTVLEFTDATVSNGTLYFYRVVAATPVRNGAPTISAEAMPWDPNTVTTASNVFLRFGGAAGDGSYLAPYNTLTAAYAGVAANGTINIFDSTTTAGAAVTIAKGVTLRSLTGDYRNSAVIFNNQVVNVATAADLNATVRIMGLEFTGGTSSVLTAATKAIAEFYFIGNYIHDNTTHGLNYSQTTNMPSVTAIHYNKFENLATSNMSAIMIKRKVYPGSSTSITYNEINNIGHTGIQLMGVTNAVIDNNTISNTGDAGIQIDGDATHSALSVFIRNNTITRAQTIPDALQGGLVFYSPFRIANATISGNTFDDCLNGFSTRGGATSAVNMFSITGNSFINNTGKGIYAGGAGLITAQGNYWGSASGPSHSLNPGGTGDASTDGVDYSAYLVAPP